MICRRPVTDDRVQNCTQGEMYIWLSFSFQFPHFSGAMFVDKATSDMQSHQKNNSWLFKTPGPPIITSHQLAQFHTFHYGIHRHQVGGNDLSWPVNTNVSVNKTPITTLLSFQSPIFRYLFRKHLFAVDSVLAKDQSLGASSRYIVMAHDRIYLINVHIYIYIYKHHAYQLLL